jgi:uncharacterized protein YndB with AHSA1/START domain
MNTFKSFALLLAIVISTLPGANTPNGSATPMTQDKPTKTMTMTRSFDAPVAEVWKHWSDSEKVMKWWGPTGFTSPLAKMDFREGGVSLVCMRAPKEFGGLDMYNTWTYKKIVPHERIEFTLNFCDKDGNKLDPSKMGLPPGIPGDVPHVITFKALADQKTEMTVIETGYTTDQAVETSRAGLEQCLDKMAASLKG